MNPAVEWLERFYDRDLQLHTNVIRHPDIGDLKLWQARRPPAGEGYQGPMFSLKTDGSAAPYFHTPSEEVDEP